MGNEVLDSRIDQVTIFREGALVERTAELRLGEDGFPKFIQLRDLPVCLENDSVRVQIQTGDPQHPAPIACDLKVSVVAREKRDESESVAAYRKEIEELEYKAQDVKRDINLVKRSVQNLRNVEMGDRPQPDPAEQAMPNPTAARIKLNGFLSTEEKALVERSQKLIEQRKEARKRITHLQAKIDEHDAPPEVKETEIKKVVSIRLNSDGIDDTVATLRLQYMVPGARWFPTYSLHVENSPPAGDLAMQASVIQATKEDWTGVKLRLSTADPQQWTELEKLNSLRIGRRQPSPAKKGWREPPQGVDALFADYDAFKRTINNTSDDFFERDDMSMDGGRMMETGAAYDEEGLDDDIAISDMVCDIAESAEMPMPCSSPPAPEFEESMKLMSCKMSAPAPKMKKMSRARRSNALGAPLRPAPMVLEEPPQDIDDLFLRYGSLRLPAITASDRGKLMVGSGASDDTPHWLTSALDEAIYRVTNLPSTPSSCVQVGSYDHFDYAYCCATPVDVPSKHKYQAIPVCRQSVAVDLRHVVVPREGNDVYRIAKITNPLQNPLLAGPVDIYLNGEFFISSNFKVIAPRGNADVGLGVEQSIKVARNTDFKEEADTGLFGSALVLCHSIEVEVINNLKSAIELEVRERAPIKDEEDKDIEITIHDVEPKWEAYKPTSRMRGRFVWKVTIAAGEKQLLKAAYDLKISAKNELVGGNRREV